MKYLLDTHTWVWWHLNPGRLSETVCRLIAAPDNYEELLLSAISPWEFCKLLEKRRLGLQGDPETWLALAMRMPKLRLVPLTPTIAWKSAILPQPFHDDPADQIIVATAREEDATLLSCDRAIAVYPHVATVW